MVILLIFTNFNPRTREGCDLQIRSIFLKYLNISIHAPVKGATFKALGAYHAGDLISIHAPVKGATKQPDEIIIVKHIISIHAPVKGAT